MGKIKSYRDLDVWRRAVGFSVRIYRTTSEFPTSEAFGLTFQMRRSSVSIASNIAEGFGRSPKEFGRYLQIALGSVAELETQLEIAYRIDYISDDQHEELTEELTIIGKQLNALQRRVLNTQ